MKVLLTISCSRIYRCNSLIKITTIIHNFLLVWRLSDLILNILNSRMAWALSWLLVWISPGGWSLLVLRIIINWIVNIWRHCIAIHYSTWVHIVLYDLFACLDHSAIVVINILIFSVFRCFILLLHFYYLLNSILIYIVHVVSINYYFISIFLCLLTYHLVVWTRTVLCK